MKNALVISLFLFFSSIANAIEIESIQNKPENRIVDFTKTLNENSISKISDKSKELKYLSEQVDLFIIVIDKPEKLTIEKFSKRLFKKWNLDHKDSNSCILILVANKDKSFSGEISYTLDDVLPEKDLNNLIKVTVFNPKNKHNLDKSLLILVEEVGKVLNKGEIKAHNENYNISIDKNYLFIIVGFFSLVIGFLLYAFINTSRKKKEYDDTVRTLARNQLKVVPRKHSHHHMNNHSDDC